MRGGETSESATTSHSRLRPSAKSPKLADSAAAAAVVVNVKGALSPTPTPTATATATGRTKPKLNPDSKPVVGSHKVGVGVKGQPFPRPRRSLLMDSGSRDPKTNESVIKNLQDQVVGLKAELERAHRLNLELLSRNTNLTHNLSAAEAKLATLTAPQPQPQPQQQTHSNGEYQRPNFKDIQKLIANKLDISNSKVKREVCIVKPSQRMVTTVDAERKAPAHKLQPPPPPPIPPAARKPPTSFQQFSQSLTKQEGNKLPGNKPTTTSVHNSIVGEIQNRSAHLLAVKADIATKADFINALIQKLHTAAYTNIEDVLKFVDWLDTELSSLADERAVLKHFKWPERKADAMREAAVEYRDLKLLENEISAFHDDTNMPCEVALKRMANLLDKSERSIQRLIKLRSSVTRSYQDCKIPTDWMLDSGIVSKIKKTSMKLAKVYMNRVTMELESIRNSDRESAQEALRLQGLHFAYRAHQFAGGLDSETMCAIEEIRQRVPGHLGGSAEPLSAITT